MREPPPSMTARALFTREPARFAALRDCGREGKLHLPWSLDHGTPRDARAPSGRGVRARTQQMCGLMVKPNRLERREILVSIAGSDTPGLIDHGGWKR